MITIMRNIIVRKDKGIFKKKNRKVKINIKAEPCEMNEPQKESENQYDIHKSNRDNMKPDQLKVSKRKTIIVPGKKRKTIIVLGKKKKIQVNRNKLFLVTKHL